MVHHIIDSVLQLTSAISLSVAALFLDLGQAFDRVMGYPSHIGSDPISRRAHLENVGFPSVVVREILRIRVYTAASLAAHDLTTLPTLIWTCEFDITLRAWSASSPKAPLLPCATCQKFMLSSAPWCSLVAV